MLDNVTKYVPHISILSFILVSLFNIGFFYEVGIHFLGVIDVTNLVYPLGIFGFILAAVLFAAPILMSFLSEVSSFAQSNDAVPKTVTWIGRRFLPLFALIFIPSYALSAIYPNYLSTNLVVALGLLAWWLLYCARAFIYLRAGSKLEYYQMGGCVVLLLLFSFYSGRVIAQRQVFSDTFYTIETDGETIKDVRLVHSSSTGFIISVDNGIIRFIPNNHIKAITANAAVGKR